MSAAVVSAVLVTTALVMVPDRPEPTERGSATAVAAELAAGTGAEHAGGPTSAGETGADGTQTATAMPASTLRVMPLGDSITYGVGSQTTSSYRVELRRRLATAGMSVDFVGSRRTGDPAAADLDHEGHSGWTIARISAGVGAWLRTYRPDAILLHVGTNDLRSRSGAARAPARLKHLLHQIVSERPEAHLFVAQITGTRRYPAQQKRTEAFNAQIPAIVASLGSSRVHVVDQSSVRNLDIRDALHPNDFGYRKMAWNWYRAMETVYRTTGTAWPATANPYAAQTAYRCLLVDADPGPGYHAGFDCRWWFRHKVTRVVDGQPKQVYRWETKRLLTKKYRVLSGGRAVTRTRRVYTWSPV
ncbi:SGNH/GDSL hydrolase family protein [Mangrovihabitans endophyticus]|uniref:SGNH hydrolase-type esterase domain-containing protein n=1 Tax=Mangrovihabitans endophyticus TaxID=1751298 RepID=A0A8J3FN14_9ACTN|nr:SGNH/GDSL hydrolase family protein [Mangrovihabitans endophyticus]GGK88111.1 hypothetical protein GCM10012284_22740 [Mangrovihabitans endophyticus]